NVVATVHREPIPYLLEFEEYVRGDSPIGRLDAPAFLAAILEWHVNSYFRIADELERAADELDQRALSPSDGPGLIGELGRLRRRIAAVRRLLAPHRDILAALGRPDLTSLAETDAAPEFRAVGERLERALEAIEHARELVRGTFEVYMTQTANRTNETMKVLTLASVLLLPGSLIAGIMGMNFDLPVFRDDRFFWLVLGAIAGIAGATLLVARFRRWI
ncbi:MAG TPA: CorA family divalent cation transporter, partial [Candidatus Limnocylindrales bacterium]|nr:CorA family divalent cation transporter [Candidatus Limnocylindrales bacterium]